MKQLFNKEELLGKTIAQVLVTGDIYGDIWIKFTDNSFVVMVNEQTTEGFGYTFNRVSISDDVKGNTDKELIELSLITVKEYELAVE